MVPWPFSGNCHMFILFSVLNSLQHATHENTKLDRAFRFCFSQWGEEPQDIYRYMENLTLTASLTNTISTLYFGLTFVMCLVSLAVDMKRTRVFNAIEFSFQICILYHNVELESRKCLNLHTSCQLFTLLKNNAGKLASCTFNRHAWIFKYVFRSNVKIGGSLDLIVQTCSFCRLYILVTWFMTSLVF